jgi:mono/diheme cytochrome c family protein
LNRAAAISIVLFCLFALAGCQSPEGPAHPLNAQEQRGELVFRANCAVCHFPYSTKSRGGPGLKGLFRKQYLPSGAPANDERVRSAIEQGRANMPSFKEALTDEQMADLIAYLHAL